MEGAHTSHSSRGVHHGHSGRAPPQIRPPRGDGEDSTPARMLRQMARTELCRSWPGCRRGDRCTFAHGVAELRNRTDLRKTSLCAKWHTGRCALRSADCPFAHGHNEMRLTQAFRETSTRRTRRPITPDQHHPGASSSAGTYVPSVALAAPTAPPPLPPPVSPPLPLRLISSETSGMQASTASYDTTSRVVLPIQHSNFTEQWDAANDLPSLGAGYAGRDRTAAVFEPDRGEEIDANHEVDTNHTKPDTNHTKPACPSDALRTSISEEAQTGAPAGDSQPSASAHDPNYPHVADPIMHTMLSDLLLGTAAQGPPESGPSTGRNSFQNTLALLGQVVQHLAEGHEASVTVTVRF